MNLRCCVLLSVASLLGACDLFDADEDRDRDADSAQGEVGESDPASDEGDDGDEDDESDPSDTTPGSDAARPQRRDAGSEALADGGRPPASNPAAMNDGAAPINRDAGFDWATDSAAPSAHDASASVRDGGLIKFDPDASGPVLNPEAQTACIGLLNNICNRSADCQVSLLGLDANMRTRLFESCRNSLWRARNCNRATRTASGFAQCSESTKSLSCIGLLGSDLTTTCANQITLQP